MIINFENLSANIKNVKIDEQKYIPVRSKKGGYTLHVNGSEKKFFLHSKYDPDDEGRLFAKNNINKPADSDYSDIVIYGLGMGYHIKHIVQQLSKEQNAYIFEKDINIIKVAFEYTDIQDYLNNDNVFFCYYEDEAALAQHFAEVLVKSDAYAIHNPSASLFPDFERLVLSRKVSPAEQLKDEILIYNGNSKYNALSTFEKYMGNYFRKSGYTPISIDIVGYYGISTLFHLRRTGFVLSFCVLGWLNNAKELKGLFDMLGIPFVFISVDDPIFQFARPNITTKKTIYTWVDKNRISTFEHFKQLGYENVRNEFLPHGGEAVNDTKSLFDHHRTIDIIMSGTYNPNFSLENTLSDIPNNDYPLVRDVVSHCISNPTISIKDGFEYIISKRVGTYAQKDLLIYLVKYGKCVYYYLISKRRYDVIKAILTAGIELTCFGEGWDKSEFVSFPNMRCQGVIDYEKGRKIFEDAKIVLNISSVIHDGSHERIFSAMSRGALCVSDYSKYIDDEFTQGKGVVFYHLDNLAELPELINKYLSDDDLRVKIAKYGHEVMKKSHTWENRAKSLLEMVSTLL